MAISVEAQRVLDAYAATVGGKQDPRYTNVTNVIQHSPSLEQALNKAVQDGTLTQLRLDSGGIANAGMNGSYQAVAGTGTITLRDTGNLQGLAFTLAHEVQHANYSRQKSEEYRLINQDLHKLAANAHITVHDYTPIIRKGLEQDRENEARAQIAGWNTYVEYQRNTNPNITDQQILEKNPHKSSISTQTNKLVNGHWVEIHNPHSDLQFNSDLTLTATNANVEAMGKHFYDKSQGLGIHRNLDYQNYYADYYIEALARAENTHRPAFRAANQGQEAQIRIDLQSLGLDAQKLQAQGLSLPGSKLDYVDASNPVQPISSTLAGSSLSNVRYNPILQAGDSVQKAPNSEQQTEQQQEPKKTQPAASSALIHSRFQAHPQLAELSEKITGAFPHLSGEQNERLTAYWANRCVRERMPVESIGRMAEEHRSDGRHLLHAINQNENQIVTANLDKALNTPVEQSLQNLSQAQQLQQGQQTQNQQEQNPQHGQAMRM